MIWGALRPFKLSYVTCSSPSHLASDAVDWTCASEASWASIRKASAASHSAAYLPANVACCVCWHST